jgi:hypothetical protein
MKVLPDTSATGVQVGNDEEKEKRIDQLGGCCLFVLLLFCFE